MKYKVNIFRKTTLLLLSVVTLGFMVGCVGDELFRDDLPDSNSKADLVPPEANFSYASAQDDFRTINFNNLSNEATTFAWDFGGGNTSSEKDPTFTFEAGEGTYQVTLTASDALGASDSTTIEVIVVEGPFQPIILEPGFEDDTLPGGGGDVAFELHLEFRDNMGGSLPQTVDNSVLEMTTGIAQIILNPLTNVTFVQAPVQQGVGGGTIQVNASQITIRQQPSTAYSG